MSLVPRGFEAQGCSRFRASWPKLGAGWFKLGGQLAQPDLAEDL
ncbi:MAG TPA: hypothetical protein VIJ15_04685 [Dermatophilaceae bacterium]